MTLVKIWIPRQALGMALKGLQTRFPYRPGERMDPQMVPSENQFLVRIHLAGDPDDAQVEYLEAGKSAGLVTTYEVSNG
jgi:hypothetical protein